MAEKLSDYIDTDTIEIYVFPVTAVSLISGTNNITTPEAGGVVTVPSGIRANIEDVVLRYASEYEMDAVEVLFKIANSSLDQYIEDENFDPEHTACRMLRFKDGSIIAPLTVMEDLELLKEEIGGVWRLRESRKIYS